MKCARLKALHCVDGEDYVWSMEIQSSFWTGLCFYVEEAWEKLSYNFNFFFSLGIEHLNHGFGELFESDFVFLIIASKERIFENWVLSSTQKYSFIIQWSKLKDTKNST